MYKKCTVTQKVLSCNHQIMAKLRNNNITSKKHPDVSLSIQARALTPEQIEAGRRLFGKLIARARQKLVEMRDESQLSNSKT